MKVFAHRGHEYEDRAKHTIYRLPPGVVVTVPDGVGSLLVAAHPEKLCDVTDEKNPAHHKCRLTRAVDALAETNAWRGDLRDTMQRDYAKLSQQKRERRHKAIRRSVIARHALRGSDG